MPPGHKTQAKGKSEEDCIPDATKCCLKPSNKEESFHKAKVACLSFNSASQALSFQPKLEVEYTPNNCKFSHDMMITPQKIQNYTFDFSNPFLKFQSSFKSNQNKHILTIPIKKWKDNCVELNQFDLVASCQQQKKIIDFKVQQKYKLFLHNVTINSIVGYDWANHRIDKPSNKIQVKRGNVTATFKHHKQNVDSKIKYSAKSSLFSTDFHFLASVPVQYYTEKVFEAQHLWGCHLDDAATSGITLLSYTAFVNAFNCKHILALSLNPRKKQDDMQIEKSGILSNFNKFLITAKYGMKISERYSIGFQIKHGLCEKVPQLLAFGASFCHKYLDVKAMINNQAEFHSLFSIKLPQKSVLLKAGFKIPIFQNHKSHHSKDNSNRKSGKQHKENICFQHYGISFKLEYAS